MTGEHETTIPAAPTHSAARLLTPAQIAPPSSAPTAIEPHSRQRIVPLGAPDQESASTRATSVVTPASLG